MGRRSGRTPRLPDEIPVTLDDRQPAALVLAGAYSRPVPGPRCLIVAPSLAAHLKASYTGREGSAPAGGYPPLPCRSPPVTQGIYQGRGPPLPRGAR